MSNTSTSKKSTVLNLTVDFSMPQKRRVLFEKHNYKSAFNSEAYVEVAQRFLCNLKKRNRTDTDKHPYILFTNKYGEKVLLFSLINNLLFFNETLIWSIMSNKMNADNSSKYFKCFSLIKQLIVNHLINCLFFNNILTNHNSFSDFVAFETRWRPVYLVTQ